MGFDISINYDDNLCAEYDAFNWFSIGSVNGNILADIFQCSWFPLTRINGMRLSESISEILDAQQRLNLFYLADKLYSNINEYINIMLNTAVKYPKATWDIN